MVTIKTNCPEIDTVMTHRVFKFPCGEVHVQVDDSVSSDGFYVNVDFEFDGSDSIIELLLVADALNRLDYHVNTLTIPYVPFSRQDRVCNPGEPLSVKVFANLINSIAAERVLITDPHSDVTTALINNCDVISQSDIFFPIILRNFTNYVLVAPDGGSLKKIYTLAKKLKARVVECSKQRDVSTGEITHVEVHALNLYGADAIIVDDCCDGGRSFVEIAKHLKGMQPGKIVLMVTHGFFTKGLQVFDGLIDEIYTRKGRVK